MRVAKSKLQMGRRCKKTLKKRLKNRPVFSSSWIKTEDEIFSNVSYSQVSKGIFSPKNPSVKHVKVNSPCKSRTPKGKNRLKRVTSSKQESMTGSKLESLKTPSKSPSAKKVRRSLYSSEDEYNADRSNASLPSTDAETLLIFENANVSPLRESDEINVERDSGLQAEIEELIQLIPSVMKCLAREGHHTSILNFFRLVNKSNFPLQNIAFQLWLEVVSWFNCENTTEMRYSENTKKFWKLGYRLFGGQFLYFMSGYKNRNMVVTDKTEKGIYPPCQSEINFAVPGKEILTSFSPYSLDECQDKTAGRRPGILNDMIDSIASAKSSKTYCLTFDGKKLKRGLTKSCGDVDLLGYEPDATLVDKKKTLENWKKPIKKIIDVYGDRDECQDIGRDLDKVERTDIADMLSSQLKTVSLNILDTRELRKKKVYAKDKLIERSGGSDWKNGKYALGISALIAFIYDIDQYIKESLDLLDELIKCICCVKDSEKVIEEKEMNLEQSSNYKSIGKSSSQSSREVKQRSKEWFDYRSRAKVTGSTIYSALGLDGLAKQKEHFDVVIGGLAEKPKSENAQTAMAHGVKNEINAVATMVGKVVPMLCPNEKLFEEGFTRIESRNDPSFMIVSPDGSVRSADAPESTTMAVEFKCPIYDVQRNFPERYLLQCLSEIEALNVESLLYLCWRPDISTVFKINRNIPVFEKAFKLAEHLYNTEKPKRPTKLCDETKALKDNICLTCKSPETVEFIGVIPSLKHTNTTNNRYDNCRFLVRRFELLLNQIIALHDKFYELQRKPATEAVAFLCCDLDRKWEKDTAHTVPVCWFPKGSSLDTSTMRNIFEYVLDECKSAGLHVPAASFDGQWHNIAVRDTNDSPLTILQLKKDVWKRVEQMTKKDQLKEIANMNRVVKIVKDGHASCVCTNGGLILPKVSSSVAKERMKSKCQSASETTSDDTENPNHVDGMSSNENDEQGTESVDNYDGGVNRTEEVTASTAGNLASLSHGAAAPENSVELTVTLNENDFNAILTQLQVDKQANAKYIWDSRKDIARYFQSGQTLRQLRDVELRIVLRYINRTRKLKLKESDRKEVKIERLCKLLQLGNNPDNFRQRTTRSKVKQPKDLTELALKKVSNTLRKSDLNIIYAEYVWPEEHRKWQEQKYYTPIQNTEIIQFYYPSYSKSRKQLEVSCVDSSHLLTRMRRKSAKGGLAGFNNEAWRNVAKSKKTALSLAMVDCIIEPMTVSVANTHFSEAVEREMRLNGDVQEAELCKDIRMWWRAEDEPGIAAEQRMQLRSALRQRLMSDMDFSSFPPPGMYINGWPVQLWEAVIASVDAKQILYSLTPNHTYNVRAFSSMMGETFFSELTLYDRRGQGTVTSQEFGQYIDTTIEKIHILMDPKRSFSYTTARKKVYNLVGQYITTDPSTTENSDDDETRDKAHIVRDHAFDDPGRLRVKAKVKEASLETDRNAVARGSLGVRWETARRNESKLLPTYRLGLDFKELK